MQFKPNKPAKLTLISEFFCTFCYGTLYKFMKLIVLRPSLGLLLIALKFLKATTSSWRRRESISPRSPPSTIALRLNLVVSLPTPIIIPTHPSTCTLCKHLFRIKERGSLAPRRDQETTVKGYEYDPYDISTRRGHQSSELTYEFVGIVKGGGVR